MRCTIRLQPQIMEATNSASDPVAQANQRVSRQNCSIRDAQLPHLYAHMQDLHTHCHGGVTMFEDVALNVSLVAKHVTCQGNELP